MKLQTKIPLQKQVHNQIDYHSELFLLGSCFAEAIGEKLRYFKFKNQINPFGILFHPLAIENVIQRAINQEEYNEEEIFISNEQWQCFDAHSRLNARDKDELLKNLNQALKVTFESLVNASHVIITLGTAWVYRHVETDHIVANCHKVPQKKFLKELLSIDQIVESLQSSVALIETINPDANFIFTVSPVRHLKDGFIENNQSKSHLIAAVHQLVEARLRKYYFPSYEIILDELRDYRFYEEDLIHPNQIAINYIWQRFSEVWINEKASETMKAVDDVQKGLSHKPFDKNSQNHLEFLRQLHLKQSHLSEQFPHIVF